MCHVGSKDSFDYIIIRKSGKMRGHDFIVLDKMEMKLECASPMLRGQLAGVIRKDQSTGLLDVNIE